MRNKFPVSHTQHKNGCTWTMGRVNKALETSIYHPESICLKIRISLGDRRVCGSLECTWTLKPVYSRETSVWPSTNAFAKSIFLPIRRAK